MGIQNCSKLFELEPGRPTSPYSKPKPGEEIVITGMSGKFPDSNDIHHFRDNLFNRIDLVSGDYRRWKPTHPEVPQRTGKMYNIDKFDAGFFGLTKRQSNSMDPMCRLLLERVYEALVDAGHHPFDLEGTKTDVYVGTCFSETEKTVLYTNLRALEAITTCQRSMIAKRINYFYKLNGVGFITDTACSSSLFALEHAYRHLKQGVSQRAIVCGTQLCLHPIVSLQFARLGVLSMDGCCKSFDNAGNGYARSEAVTVIILEKANDAKRIYAEVIHSKTNCDGYKEEGITFPSSHMQKVLMREFYNECGVDPRSLSFIEAHGTGTKVGDPEELITLDEIFCKGREKPLHIGTIKSNIGHNEAVSGLCSIIKVLIGFESGFIPPNINYSTPRKGVEGLEQGRLVVVTEKMPWPDNNGLVGINSFGFGGGNGHILLRWNNKVKVNKGLPKDNLPRLVCVSGRATATISSILEYASNMDTEFIALTHQVFRKIIPNQLCNGYGIVSKQGEIERVIREGRTNGNKLRIVFCNVDKGFYRCAERLMEMDVFSGSIQRIHKIIETELNLDASQILMTTTHEILATIIVQAALADMLKELNLNIEEIVGVGYGEFAAAYLDGYLSLREMILITYYTSLGNTNKLKQILADKNRQVKKWSPVYNMKKYTNFYPQGSLDYFLQNIYKPTNFNEQGKRKTKNNLFVNLIIGSDKENLRERDILMIGNGSTAIIDLLRSLGRLFLMGFSSDVAILYPKVLFPVSRGTPMLSPLIKWNHSDSYTVHLYQSEVERKSGQRVIPISLRIEDWNFLAGHVIDGRNLFPATGYLAAVWESYAIIIGKLMTDIRMVFEDVKFLRATNVPPEGTLTLKVMIQMKNRLFEVLDDDVLLVTGRVYDLAEETKFVNASVSLNDNEEEEMEEADVYKELRLRGYHYINQFRAIKKFNFKRDRAMVSWTGNWITFMDVMLQVQMLSVDTRNLYVPTGIKRVVIDGPKHIRYTVKYNNLMPVIYRKDTEIIACEGIEITGLVANVIPRRKPAEPVLETCKFVPYQGRLERNVAVRCIVQTILENSNTIKVKSVEVLTFEEGDDAMMPLIQQSLGDLPLYQSELKVLTSKEKLDFLGIEVEDKSLDTELRCLIVIARGILENQELLVTALRVTREVSGFIISKESKEQPVKTSEQIQILACYETEKEKILLLKESTRYVERIPINIHSCDDLSWIEPLRSSMTKKVLLYTEDVPMNGTLGLVNCLRREHLGNNISTMIIFDGPPFNAKNDFYKSQLEKNLAVNVYKNGKWGSYRHLLLPDVTNVQRQHCYVNAVARGDLSSLKWLEGPLSVDGPLEPKENLVKVHCSAVNFRDIMTASGRLTPDAVTRDRVLQECIQGFEYSGVLARDPSKRVMGSILSGALSTMVIADPNVLWDIPDDWTFEDAATIPVVYQTVLYAFVTRGKMKRGQSVLIHSGTGGVGQAAINVATHMGCTVFTTVGTPEKREFIRKHFPSINDEHIGDSRSTSFEQMVFKGTGGRGVDFVLNSLVEEKLLASVRCLAYNGTFLEIGKFDLANDSQLGAILLEKQARYEGIMLDRFFTGFEKVQCAINKLIRDGIKSGLIKPLIRTVFSSDKVEEAFRYMSTGKHMGKVVIKVREGNENLFTGIPRLSCDPLACYIILGGLGGFGLELADWLVVRGAKHIVLTSRTGVKNGYQCYRLSVFESYGVKVVIRNGDASTEEGCRTLLAFAESLGPVEGIFNLAVVLKDALFENQTEETFKISLTPKAYATRNLDLVSREMCPNLKYFVVFSSVSCGRGNSGQSNYGMANSVMERVCEIRKNEGYPALAIQWGAIGEVGLVADMQENHKELVIGGTLQQRLSNCLQVLDRLLKQDDPIVGSMVVAEKRSGAGARNAFDAVLNIIGVTNLKTISIHATFPELGMDSMMAVEVKQTLERDYEVFLTAQDIRNMTIAKLKDLVTEQVESVSKPTQNKLETELPEDIKLLLRHIGDEEHSNIPIVKITSRISQGSSLPVIALAGIEGMANIYKSIGKQLSANLTCLQFCSGNHLDSIEEIAEPLVKIVSSTTPGEFTIIAYSFGCVVAIELMRSLESLGKVGKAFFIDGAPELMARLAKMYFSFYDEEILQITLLCILMARYMPLETILKLKPDIARHKTHEDKVKFILGVTPAITQSEKYIAQMIKAALSRLKAVWKYKPKGNKLNSKIVLAKPTKQSLVEIADDYNLSSLTKQPVEVKVIEGNHVTILENKELIREIEAFLKPDKRAQKILLRGNMEMPSRVETKTI